ncbi:MAG: insulinase family protein [Burkholderiaceae bacterium]|nr:insulinase family protein [Burkholderiaceae bacterium]
MNTIKKITIATCMATTVVSAGATISVENKMNLPENIVVGPTVEGITEYRLANGLKVILFPDASKATATVNMTYLVGSRHENYGETGMAHLLEHLLFKGSKNYPDPTKEFTRRGFSMNGSTWLDRTNYYVSFNATEDNLQWALGWMADAMRNSFIAQKDLDSEMSVVRNEYEMGENSPPRVMMKRMQSMIYDWHNYGKSTIGNRSDIENVEIRNLQGFYQQFYRPDNAVLTVSGKFDVTKVLGWIFRDFSSIENPKQTLPKEWTVEPTADGERYFEIRRRGESQLVSVAYRIPSALHADMAAIETAVDILSDTPTGRLYDALVKTGLATNVYGYAIGAQKPGYVMFGAVVKKGEPIEKVKNVLIQTIETSFEEKPITTKELERSKLESATSYERMLADPQEFGIGLSEFIALGDWRLFFYSRDRMAKVTTEQADSVASRYFVRDNRVVGVFLPEENPKRAVIPSAPSAEELLASYVPKTEGDVAESFEASFDNLNQRTERLRIGNLEVALLPKKTRGKTVTVSMHFDWGSEKSLFNQSMNSRLATAMLTRGTSTKNREQIEDEMTQLKMQGGLTSFVTTAENLPKALKLVADLWKHSAFPTSEFEQLKKQLVVATQSQLDKPDALAIEAINQHFNTYPKGDIRHKSSLKEVLTQLNDTSLESVKNFHKTMMGTARGQIAIVGDFDPKIVTEILKDDFSTFVSKADYQRIVHEYRPVQATRIVIDTPEKENANLIAKSVFPISDTDADAPALMVANWILGGGTGLSNRLIDRLRQKEGLSYGAGSSVIIPSKGNNGMFVFRAIVAPQNLLKAEASAKDVIEQALKNGFTETEVTEAKKGLIQAKGVARAQDSVIVASWLAKMKEGRDWNFSRDLEKKIEALTTSDVNTAFRKYIKPNEITWVLAGDQSKAQP